jgi:hypothetical protein
MTTNRDARSSDDNFLPPGPAPLLAPDAKPALAGILYRIFLGLLAAILCTAMLSNLCNAAVGLAKAKSCCTSDETGPFRRNDRPVPAICLAYRCHSGLAARMTRVASADPLC